MINLRALQRRLSSDIPNRALILVLVPLFLIISTSVLPVIISITQNKEMSIIAETMAKLSNTVQGRSVYSVNQHENRSLLSHSVNHGSPTPTVSPPASIDLPSHSSSSQSSSTPSSSALSPTTEANVTPGITQGNDSMITYPL